MHRLKAVVDTEGASQDWKIKTVFAFHRNKWKATNWEDVYKPSTEHKIKSKGN